MADLAATERSLIRTMAGASRPLDADLPLSPLQAIDRLQKFDIKFRECWVGWPWLVLEDRYTLPANMPVHKMLDEIEAHGNPIGIVGLALLPRSKRYAVLQMHFRKDEKSKKTVEHSAKVATEILAARIRQIQNLHEQGKSGT